jgi:hypothetical protein
MSEISANDFWLVASPLDSNPREMLEELQSKLEPMLNVGEKRQNAQLSSISVPEFKAGFRHAAHMPLMHMAVDGYAEPIAVLVGSARETGCLIPLCPFQDLRSDQVVGP